VIDVFAYPVGSFMKIHQALMGSPIIENHFLRHEQEESFVALRYTRSTEKAGVCVATSGPGATNLLLALADALLDSESMVADTGYLRQDGDVPITEMEVKIDFLLISIACQYYICEHMCMPDQHRGGLI
jgi:acetolactate synthase I/II/III large subunit